MRLITPMPISARISGVDPRETALWDPVTAAAREVLDDLPDLSGVDVDATAQQIADAAIERALLDRPILRQVVELDDDEEEDS